MSRPKHQLPTNSQLKIVVEVALDFLEQRDAEDQALAKLLELDAAHPELEAIVAGKVKPRLQNTMSKILRKVPHDGEMGVPKLSSGLADQERRIVELWYKDYAKQFEECAFYVIRRRQAEAELRKVLQSVGEARRVLARPRGEILDGVPLKLADKKPKKFVRMIGAENVLLGLENTEWQSLRQDFSPESFARVKDLIVGYSARKVEMGLEARGLDD